ncbi:hypothetical protein Pyn_31818 [Prunus yedoensis var. nudiflora]|uniref:Uncharacterized protein n=1 Tax=Prunus yedoensis var. nudiflora TaxID=2094558 RepID=A0A314UT78_PRUYE|nr:hypothetical protein Pyn_31818 [Prunus yedoensis var. nudiflora]
MTRQFDEDGRAWYDDSNVAEFIWPSTSVASMAGVTALTMAEMMAPITARMTTAYHVQSDNCCHGLNDGRRHCRNCDCLPCPGWRLLSMFRMAAPAVVEVTALPLSFLHALSLSMAGVTALVLGWPRFLAEADAGRSGGDTASRRNVYGFKEERV